MKNAFIGPVVLIFLAGCVHNQGQNTYNYNEVGQSSIVEYATVVKVKSVEINGRNTGGGGLVGGLAGAGAGSYVGNGSGSVWAAGAGALLGIAVGSAAEQAAANQKGYEYTIVTEHKSTKTVVQYQNEKDIVFKPGDHVMLQTTGEFQRLLTADDLPEEIKRPKGIKIVDE